MISVSELLASIAVVPTFLFAISAIGLFVMTAVEPIFAKAAIIHIVASALHPAFVKKRGVIR